MHKNLYEILDEVALRKSKSDKVIVLKCNASFALKNVLKGIFDPNIKFVFDKIPEYKNKGMPAGMSYTSIDQEINRAYLFEQNNPRVDPNLSMKRRTEILIQMLESLEKKEADIFIAMLMKDTKIAGLNYAIVAEAFPGLLPDKPTK